jgi:hypothetical protein
LLTIFGQGANIEITIKKAPGLPAPWLTDISWNVCQLVNLL